MNKIMKMIISFLVVAGGGTLVVKAEDLTIKSIERSEVEERVRVENEVIHFDDYDEYATYTLTLENPTSTKLQVTNINLTNNECVSINTDNLNNTIVDANSTKEVTLILTSNKCNVNQDNTALLSFKSKEYTEDKQEEKEDIVSPNTYGNISVFLVALFILTAIYISLYIYSKKKPFKYLKLSTIIYLSLLIITTITYTIMTSFSANEEPLSLTFSYTYKPRRVLMRRNYTRYNDYDDYDSEDEGTFWQDDWDSRGEILNIYIQNTIEEPDEYEEVYDASMNQDESILVYKVINPDDSEYYDLYMMADGEILTNVDSTFSFEGFSNLESIDGLSHINTSMTEYMVGMFACDENLKELDLSHFNTSKVTDMSLMFYGSGKMRLNLNSFDTSNVTNMLWMFYYFGNEDTELTIDVSNFNTSNVINMEAMFAFNSNAIVNIRGLNKLDTSKVTNMSYMLSNYNSSTPLDLSFLTINEGTDISYLLSGYGSTAALDISKLDISNVTSLEGLFSGYKSNQPLDFSNFNTSHVTNMSRMFYGYSSSAPLDLSHFDTSNVTNMSRMFYGYSSSAPLDLSHFDTSNVTNMSYMFSRYSSNAPLDLSHLDTSSVTNMSSMFSYWNSTADLDISSMNFTTLPQHMFRDKQKANKIYVANDTVKNLLKNSGWPYMTDANIIVKGN